MDKRWISRDKFLHGSSYTFIERPPARPDVAAVKIRDFYTVDKLVYKNMKSEG